MKRRTSEELVEKLHVLLAKCPTLDEEVEVLHTTFNSYRASFLGETMERDEIKTHECARLIGKHLFEADSIDTK